MIKNIIKTKYLLSTEKDEADMFIRISSALYTEMQKHAPLKHITEAEIHEAINGFGSIVLGGSNMAGIGNEEAGTSLSNCFVVPSAQDNYEDIIMTELRQVVLMTARGGVGHDLSNIRPAGFPVANAAKTSTGIVPFMARYSNATKEVAQGGRRGALMLSISIHHPEVIEFILSKSNQTQVTGANISVRISDSFMNSVKTDSYYPVFFPDIYPSDKVIELAMSSNNKTYWYELDGKQHYVKLLKAKDVWNTLIKAAHGFAEPGVLFWDTILNDSPAKSLLHKFPQLKETSTNPCGEIPLCPYDSCRLLALNLYTFVLEPFTKNARFDYDKFKKMVILATYILDTVVDIEIGRLEIIRLKAINENKPETANVMSLLQNQAKQFRRLGIGAMGGADMWAALGLPYGSVDIINPSELINAWSLYASVKLATEYAKVDGSIGFTTLDNPALLNGIETLEFLLSNEEFCEFEDNLATYGVRNLGRTTLAPTGTTSMVAEVSSAMEPVFTIVGKRRRRISEEVRDAYYEDNSWWIDNYTFHKPFRDWYIVNWPTVTPEGTPLDLMNIKAIESLIAVSPWAGQLAQELPVSTRVATQAALQQHIDHSISSTVNLPSNATVEDVSKVYITAWENNLKGITVYRDGSRHNVITAVTSKEEPKVRKRPKKVDAKIFRFKDAESSWIAFVGILDGRPYEIFAGLADDDGFPVPKYVRKGQIVGTKEEDGTVYSFQYTTKRGTLVEIHGLQTQFNPEFWNYAKLISSLLQNNIKLENLVKTLYKISLTEELNTWTKGVARVIKSFIKDGTKYHVHICPDCGAKDSLVYQSGCATCSVCASSKCS